MLVNHLRRRRKCAHARKTLGQSQHLSQKMRLEPIILHQNNNPLIRNLLDDLKQRGIQSEIAWMRLLVKARVRAAFDPFPRAICTRVVHEVQLPMSAALRQKAVKRLTEKWNSVINGENNPYIWIHFNACLTATFQRYIVPRMSQSLDVAIP